MFPFDVQSALKNLFASTLQEMMEAEPETHLGYVKHDAMSKKTSNGRNGKMPAKTVNTELGVIEIRADSIRRATRLWSLHNLFTSSSFSGK